MLDIEKEPCITPLPDTNTRFYTLTITPYPSPTCLTLGVDLAMHIIANIIDRFAP